MIPEFPKVDFTPLTASDSDYDKEIAGTIYSQIDGLDPMAFQCLNCREVEAIDRGLRLKNAVVFQTVVEDMVNDPDMLNSLVQVYGNIDITLNSGDYFDIVGYTVDKNGVAGGVTFTEKDVMAFDTWEVLRKIWE